MIIVDSSLKSAIDRYYYSTTMSTTDKLGTEILLYKYIKSVAFSDLTGTNFNAIYTLVSSYASQFEKKFTSLKDEYSAYEEITKFLEKLGYAELLQLSVDDIDYAYKKYLNKIKITKFSTKSFGCEMYGFDSNSMNPRNFNHLKNIHMNEMVPIVIYFTKKYGVDENTLKIASADEVENNPGKIILFKFNDISSVQVYAEINNTCLKELVKSCDLEYPYVRLMTK
jgi:hypothetical protein